LALFPDDVLLGEVAGPPAIGGSAEAEIHRALHLGAAFYLGEADANAGVDRLNVADQRGS